MAPLPFAFQRARRQATFPPSRHDRILSNSAAEFVELRAGGQLCRRGNGGPGRSEQPQKFVGGSSSADAATSSNLVSLDDDHQGPKFVSGLDRFVPADDAPSSAEYYKASRDMIVKFQLTLVNFTKTLQSRKMFKSLQIETRDPANYDLDYILKITSMVQEHKEGLENTQTIKRFIRRCCKGAADNNTILKGFLSMIPSDTYGSVLSGGLTLILAAAESHEKSRMEIQATLADIPRKLSNIQRVSKAHRKTPELHRCADQVFLSIFVILERIINKLSMGFVEKGMTKLKGQGDDIKEAVEEFGIKVTEFQEEVDVCAQLRLGRMEEDQKTIIRMLEGLPNKKEMEALVHTLLYRLNASHPNFNSIDGSAQRVIEAVTDTSRIQDALPTQDTKKELAASWFSELGSFDPMPDKHIKELLLGLADLSIEQKDLLPWIIESDTVGDWLASSTSGLLYLYAETPPDELVNALSLSAATLVLTLTGAAGGPVLSFFCGLRRNDSRENPQSGPKAVRNSFNGQLMKFIMDRHSNADFSFFQDEKLMKKSRSRSRYAKKLFHELLGALPEGNMVHIVLDSFSRLGGMPGDKDKGDDIIKDLAALKFEFPDLVVKVLVVDAMPDCPVSKLADLTLYVPDDVDGWKNDVNLDVLDQRNREVLRLSKRRAKVASSAEDSSGVSSGVSSGSESD